MDFNINTNNCDDVLRYINYKHPNVFKYLIKKWVKILVIEGELIEISKSSIVRNYIEEADPELKLVWVKGQYTEVIISKDFDTKRGTFYVTNYDSVYLYTNLEYIKGILIKLLKICISGLFEKRWNEIHEYFKFLQASFLLDNIKSNIRIIYDIIECSSGANNKAFFPTMILDVEYKSSIKSINPLNNLSINLYNYSYCLVYFIGSKMDNSSYYKENLFLNIGCKTLDFNHYVQSHLSARYTTQIGLIEFKTYKACTNGRPFLVNIEGSLQLMVNSKESLINDELNYLEIFSSYLQYEDFLKEESYFGGPYRRIKDYYKQHIIDFVKSTYKKRNYKRLALGTILLNFLNCFGLTIDSLTSLVCESNILCDDLSQILSKHQLGQSASLRYNKLDIHIQNHFEKADSSLKLIESLGYFITASIMLKDKQLLKDTVNNDSSQEEETNNSKESNELVCRIPLNVIKNVFNDIKSASDFYSINTTTFEEKTLYNTFEFIELPNAFLNNLYIKIQLTQDFYSLMNRLLEKSTEQLQTQ